MERSPSTSIRPPAGSVARSEPHRDVVPGLELGGFRVQRVIDRRAGWTAAEAVAVDAPAAAPVRLWISPPDAAGDSAAAERLQRLEALRRQAETATLPLVPLVALGRDGTRLFAAWARAPGLSLAERLARGPLERRDAIRLVVQVGRALDVLHSLGIPHAPLTTDTIILTREGALLDDYGIVGPPARACTDPMLLAAADHLPPEVALGDALTIQADVYALTSVLVEALTGAPPFPYDRPLLVLHAHLAQRPPRVAERLGLPTELDRVVRRGLHKQPDRRPRTASALARAVHAALREQRRTTLGPVAPAGPSRPRPQPQRRPAPVPPAPVVPPPARPSRAGRPGRPRPRRGPASAGTRATVALGLVLAAVAGFGAANLGNHTRNSSASSSSAAADAVSAQAATDVLQRLDARRAAGRHALRAAPTAARQARAADALSAAYAAARADARASIQQPSRSLDHALAGAQDAYRRLAAAARQTNPNAYNSAATAIAARERAVTAAFRRATR